MLGADGCIGGSAATDAAPNCCFCAGGRPASARSATAALLSLAQRGRERGGGGALADVRILDLANDGGGDGALHQRGGRARRLALLQRAAATAGRGQELRKVEVALQRGVQGGHKWHSQRLSM
jgi:hypothetical protein